MAALHKDTMADEVPLNRQRRNPVSPLLSPFKWAANSVASLADLDPAICVALCKIGPTRIHVVALVLAHLKVEPTPELGRLLLCGSIRQVIADTLGRDLPAGLGSAVARMPAAKVLALENYRRLIALLDHRPTAKLLFHSDPIDDALIDLRRQLAQGSGQDDDVSLRYQTALEGFCGIIDNETRIGGDRRDVSSRQLFADAIEFILSKLTVQARLKARNWGSKGNAPIMKAIVDRYISNEFLFMLVDRQIGKHDHPWDQLGSSRGSRISTKLSWKPAINSNDLRIHLSQSR